jgi:hypothetical protein
MRSSDFIKPLKENASVGGTSSSAVAVSMEGGAEGAFTKKDVQKRLQGYTNALTPGGKVKVKKNVAESSMAKAEQHSTGPKFTGYWKGTDSGTPGTKMVGGACEDTPTKHQVLVTVSEPDHQAVTQRKETRQRKCTVTAGDREGAVNAALAFYKRKGYKVHDHHYVGTVESLKEFGADNGSPTSTGTNAVDQQAKAKELAQLSQVVNKAKGAGVLPSTISPSQGAQAVASNVGDVNKANMAQKKEMGAVADSFNDFMKASATTPGGQAALSQVLQTMKKVKMGAGTTGGGG